MPGCKNCIEIPTHDMGYEFDYKHIDYENHDNCVDRKLLLQIQDLDEIINPELICSFNSAFGKDVFRVYYVESKTSKNSVNSLVVTDYSSDRIIDYYNFISDSVFLDVLYDKSEPLKDKGLVFNFIKKEVNSRGIISGFNKTINQNGKFGESEIWDSNKFTFKLLTSLMKHSGEYIHKSDSFDIILELKDGIERDNYAYKLSLQTPKQCEITYMNLKGVVEDRMYILDSIDSKSILITNDALVLKLELNNEECGDIDYQTIEMMKK